MSENQTGKTPAGPVLQVYSAFGDGMVGIPGGHSLLIAAYVWEGSQLFSLMQGAFVITSGEVGKVNPEDMTVRTPITTIGICGTKYSVSVDLECGKIQSTVKTVPIKSLAVAARIYLTVVPTTTRLRWPAVPLKSTMFQRRLD